MQFKNVLMVAAIVLTTTTIASAQLKINGREVPNEPIKGPALASPKKDKSRSDYAERLGTCQYASAVLRRAKNPSCALEEKAVCTFDAECSKPVPGGQAETEVVSGTCIVSVGEKCPSDPLDCLAKNSFEVIALDEKAIASKTKGSATANPASKIR